jgi:hypothetical protein
MENVPEALTAKEGEEMQDSKEYKINSEKDTFQVKIGKNKLKNKIIFRALKTNELVENFYEHNFSFEEIVQLDKTFRAYDELDEIFLILLNIFEDKKVEIKEVKDDSIVLVLKILSIIGMEKNVEIKLIKHEMNQDSLVKEFCKKINQLEQENKSLQEKKKSFRNELNELKKWKNEKRMNFKMCFKKRKIKLH